MRTVATNAIEPASSTSASFGFIPIPGKGGKTTNAEIYESICGILLTRTKICDRIKES